MIIFLLTLHMPLKRPSLHSKPWWTETLSRLHQDLHMAQRVYRREHTPSLLSESRASRLVYFKAIKKAKKEHWKNFLAKIGAQDVWSVQRLTVGRQPDSFPSFPDASSPIDINTALLSHFFSDKNPTPTPSILRPFRDIPSVGPEEIAYALSKSSNTSAPSPDQIHYGIWKEVNKANPSLLLALLGPLLTYGFHPASLKEANGIVLSKPGKPDYTAPSSFRVIVLLQTVSKILERIIASRLSPLARMVGLVKRNQYGLLPGLSTFDACAALTQEIRTL